MSRLHRNRAKRMAEKEAREERGQEFDRQKQLVMEHLESLIADSWRNVWQLPLHKAKYCDWVWSANDVPALTNFREDWEYDDAMVQYIVDVINGKKKSDFVPEWTADGCEVRFQGKYAFLVRGWGHLTGRGALNLRAELAAKIQDGFVKYIIDRLNGSNS